MADLDNLIDSKISLISHQDVRYDGTLFSINTSESSIVLKDVKCLGTEGRVTDPSKTVPSNTSIIPFVTFPGQEIKDLYVHESPEAAPAPQPSARKQESKPQNKPQHQQQQNAPRNQNSNDNRGQQQNQRQNQQHHQQQQQQSAPRQAAQAPQQRREQQAPRQQNEPRTSNAGTGAHLLHLREKKAGDGSIQAPTDNKSVFDFEAGLNIFKKEEVLLKVATEDGAHEVVKEAKYKKDDFFDMLSTDRQSREEGQQARMTGAQERSLNQDTFGAIALQGGGGYRRNNYSRGGGNNGYNNNNNNGGGYGGRGRGRGRGGRGSATN